MVMWSYFTFPSFFFLAWSYDNSFMQALIPYMINVYIKKISPQCISSKFSIFFELWNIFYLRQPTV